MPRLLPLDSAGYLHRPQHVGCGHVVESHGGFSFALPISTTSAVMDHGSNNLLFDPQNETKLRSYLGTYVVSRTTESQSPRSYAEDFLHSMPPQRATDSRVEMAKAYDGIKICLEFLEGKCCYRAPERD